MGARTSSVWPYKVKTLKRSRHIPPTPTQPAPLVHFPFVAILANFFFSFARYIIILLFAFDSSHEIIPAQTIGLPIETNLILETIWTPIYKIL